MKSRAVARIGWSLVGFCAALSMSALAFSYANRSTPLPADYGTRGGYAMLAVASLAFPIVGALIISRDPNNSLGRISLAAGLCIAVNVFANEYSAYSLVTNPGFLSGGVLLAWLGDWLWIPYMVLVGVFWVLLFPDGRLPGRRWKAVAWVAVIGTVLAVASQALHPRKLANIGIDNPFGIDGAKALFEYLEASMLLVLLPVIAAAASMIIRYRRSEGETRQQLKWFASAGLFLAGMFLVTGLVVTAAGYTNVPLSLRVLQDVAGLSVAGIPIATGFAILRYRLYDIDIVINKTLVFGALAAFITVVYVAIVVGIGAAVGSGDKPNLALSIAATAVVAVAFQPMRERVQRFANRLVYGERATPYEVLSDFSSRVAGSYATEEVTPAIARILAEATGAQRASVWLAVERKLTPAASHPDQGHDAQPVSLTDGHLPAIKGVDGAAPVAHQGELLGALTISKRPGEKLTPVEAKLMEDLASQAGLVLKNVRLTAQLQAKLDQISKQAKDIKESRQRIVAAQDQERRRLERDIHDGAQQHLVALAVKLKLAKTMAAKNPERAKAMLEQLKGEAADALATLTDLARGIYPPVLQEHGIAAALSAQAGKATVPVAIEADTVSRHDPQIEAAVYFCCLEALQNVAKYARATRAKVHLEESDGELAFSVTDDGVGFDTNTTTYGTGLQGMADRLAAVGGSLEVISTPGEGTTVGGRIPAAAGDPVVA